MKLWSTPEAPRCVMKPYCRHEGLGYVWSSDPEAECVMKAYYVS